MLERTFDIFSEGIVEEIEGRNPKNKLKKKNPENSSMNSGTYTLLVPKRFPLGFSEYISEEIFESTRGRLPEGMPARIPL